jgi:hypothetical protein
MMALAGSAVALGAVSAAWIGLSRWGRSRWAATKQELFGQLLAARLPASALRYDVRELDGLPAPVQRYFRAVLQDGQPIVKAATLAQTGTFNLNAFGHRAWWIPFTSEQRIATNRSGFVWNARMAVWPGIPIFVLDAYTAGVGTLQASLLGVLTLARRSGTGELAQGELMRYMMEAAWYPTALLPSQGTQWSATDETSADARMADRDIGMTLRFRFGANGLIESIHAQARGAMVGGSIVMMPWEGRLSNYRVRAGMLVPLTGEAAWLPTGTRAPYWRGTITSAAYEMAA